MQVIAKERRLDILAELTCRLVASERNDSDALPLRRPPLSVEPRPRDDKVRALWIVLLGVAENLPWSPRVFLVPKSRHVQIRHGGSVKLVDPGFLLPEFVVIRMFDRGVPVRNGPVK